MKQCDLCKKEVKELILLKEEYRTKTVNELCSDCYDQINDALFRLTSHFNELFSKTKTNFIKNLYRRFTEKGERVFE